MSTTDEYATYRYILEENNDIVTSMSTIGPSISPSTIPSLEIASSNPTIICSDDETFHYPSLPHKSCQWVGRTSNRRDRVCKKHRMVRKACPFTCGA